MITIAGGGLAGLGLACGLRRGGVPVTVIEVGSYPRHRVCGEFISGVRPETLKTLGVGDCLGGARRHRSLVWLENGRKMFRGELPVAALGVSRHALDLRLRDRLIELGGEVVTGQRVALPGGGQAAEGLVWTAGRRAAGGRWIGLKAHLRIDTTADLEMHCGANGYAGLAGVEDGWTNVCGLFRCDRSLAGRGPDLLAAYLEAGGNVVLAGRVRAAGFREGSFCAVAGFEPGRQPEVAGLLRLGDAERMIPPFTGNGMSMAFQSAETALGPLLDWSAGRHSWTAAANLIRRRLDRRFRCRMAVAGLVHRLLLRPAERSAIASVAAAGFLPFRPLLALVR